MASPREVYRERLATREAAVDECRAVEARISWLRLVIFLAGMTLVWLAALPGAIHWGWVAIPVGFFGAVMAWHDRVIERRRRAERAVRFYAAGVERLEDRWAGRGNPGDRFADRLHPYSGDLDLYGRGSLFELLCAARTRSGERTLAAWLEQPADRAEVLVRQEAVEELRGELDLREDLAIIGEGAGDAIHPDALVAWGAEPARLNGGWVPWVAGLLAPVNLGTLFYWAWFALKPVPTTQMHHLPVLLSLTASALLALYWRKGVLRVMSGVDRPARELRELASILERVENERFRSARLIALVQDLQQDGRPASARVAGLARWVEIWDWRENKLFAPMAAMLFLGTQLAFAVERWRAESGPRIEAWIVALGQIEALVSLAGFAYEHPDHPFPELTDDGPCFRGERVGHPLLPDSRCVRNDIELSPELRLLVVSGSNMSGKSTMLRTVGINAALALAGAPVRAGRLILSPLAVGACMRVVDSLQEGTSHFYAEIKRLRRIVDISEGERPLLFLFDEILHGTHSDDRRVGAQGLMRELIGRGAIGIVTTHDLALAKIADDLAPRAANVHFEDRLREGRMSFDYKLRPGVVRKSNALELMRAVGLDV